MFLAWCERSMLIKLFLKVWWCKSTKERKKQRIGGEKKKQMNDRVWVLLIAMMCLVAVAPIPAAASAFASEVVANSPDLDGSGFYNDPQAVLGEPANWNSDCCAVSMVCPAWGTDQGGNKVITTIGSSSYIVVKFDHHVEDDLNNPFGIDFLVFGNSFYSGSGSVNCNTDMETYYLIGGAFEEPVLVAVSQDGTNWYEYSSGPYGDTGKYPTNAREWDRENHQWGGLLDFTKPVDPSHYPFNDCCPGSPKYVADIIEYCYSGSAGGTGFDLAESGYSWIQYIKVYGDAGHYGGEIDAFADVSPSSLPDLNITEKSEEWVSFGDKTYNVTYTVKNIGNTSANASDTGIYIDGVFNRTVACCALAPGANETKTVGPFTMSGANDTIKICADNDSVVAESNEGNNCIENVFKYLGLIVIPIYSGKNLISVPLIQDDPSLDAVFGENPVTNDRVHRYNNSLGLYKSSRYTGTSWWNPENVEPIEPEAGYVYERVGTDITLNITGARCTGTISTPIYNGKNLIGYVNFTETTLSTFNDPVTNDRVHRYNNSLGLYKSSRYTGTSWWNPENVEPIEVGVGYVYERVGADFDWTYDA